MKMNMGKRKSLKTASAIKIFLFSLALLIVVFASVGIVFSKYVFDTVADSHLRNLQQSGYSLNIVKNVVKGMSDNISASLDDIVRAHPDQQDLNACLTSESELGEIFEDQINLVGNLGYDMAVEIVMVNGYRYSSNPIYESSLKAFVSSQWFINMVYGDYSDREDEIWGIRTIDPEEENLTVLSFSRAIYAQDGSVLGVLIVSINHSVLYETYSRLLNSYEGISVHVTDENGTIISHQNEDLIGFHMYDATYMATKMPYNASEIQRIGHTGYMVTTYFEPNSGWILIERIPLTSLLRPLQSLLETLVLIAACSLIMSLLMGWRLSKSITKRLSLLSTYMSAFRSEQSIQRRFVTRDSDYAEIYTLGSGFNSMMENISALIENIRVGELERQKVEFNFLQAQINPHFLHNTLLSVKSLIVLKRYDNALDMLQSFIRLVRTPINAENPMISLLEEIESIKSYIRIMEYRYNAEFSLEIDLPAEMEAIKIPQMTLQPIIENCIFHGFSGSNGENVIRIQSQCSPTAYLVSIYDNGKGMTQEQVEGIWTKTSMEQHSFNHVSMGNILKRFKRIYGEDAAILVESTLGTGTTVMLQIPRKGAGILDGAVKIL